MSMTLLKTFNGGMFFAVKHIVILILALCNAGCSYQKRNAVNAAVDSAAMRREADSLFVTVEELARMTPEVKERIKAGIILSKYVSLNGDTYSLDISKEEAGRLGVKENVYDEICKDIENTNDTIRKLKAEGKDIGLVDVRKEAEKADCILRERQSMHGKETAEQVFKRLNEFFTDKRNEPLIDSLRFYSISLNSQAGLVTVGLEDCSTKNITRFKTRVMDSPSICFKKEEPAVFD